MSITNFDQLLEAGVHFGHLKRKWTWSVTVSTLSTCIKP